METWTPFTDRESAAVVVGDSVGGATWALGGTTALYLLHRDPESFMPPAPFAGDLVVCSSNALDHAVQFLAGEYVLPDDDVFVDDPHLIGVSIPNDHEDELLAVQTVNCNLHDHRHGRVIDQFNQDVSVVRFRQRALQIALERSTSARTLDETESVPVLTPGGVALTALASMVVPGAFDIVEPDVHFAPLLLAAVANPMEFTATLRDGLDLVIGNGDALTGPVGLALADILDHLQTYRSDLQSSFTQVVASSVLQSATRDFWAALGPPGRGIGI
ncbi:MAG: hypothetical protein ACOYNI_03195 [Acidimicrobiia bacterium]